MNRKIEVRFVDRDKYLAVILDDQKGPLIHAYGSTAVSAVGFLMMHNCVDEFLAGCADEADVCHAVELQIDRESGHPSR